MGYEYGYDVDVAASAATNALNNVMVVALVSVGIVLVAAVLMLIGQWKCFKKAGYQGWEALIGGHSQFVNCTLAGVNPILILYLTFGSLLIYIPVVGILAYIALLIYYQFVVGINTAKAFGKGTGFGVALAIPLSAPIAWFILGGNNVNYVGVQKNSNVNQNNNQSMNNYQQPMPEPIMSAQSIQNNTCTKCGAPTNQGDKFCMSCGNQLF